MELQIRDRLILDLTNVSKSYRDSKIGDYSFPKVLCIDDKTDSCNQL